MKNVIRFVLPVQVYIYTYIYIYTERERERERKKNIQIHTYIMKNNGTILTAETSRIRADCLPTRRYIWQKRPIIRQKRPIIWQKRPVHTAKETYHTAKETYHMAKGTCSYGKRDLFIYPQRCARGARRSGPSNDARPTEHRQARVGAARCACVSSTERCARRLAVRGHSGSAAPPDGSAPCTRDRVARPRRAARRRPTARRPAHATALRAIVARHRPARRPVRAHRAARRPAPCATSSDGTLRPVVRRLGGKTMAFALVTRALAHPHPHRSGCDQYLLAPPARAGAAPTDGASPSCRRPCIFQRRRTIFFLS